MAFAMWHWRGTTRLRTKRISVCGCVKYVMMEEVMMKPKKKKNERCCCLVMIDDGDFILDDE